MKHRWGTTGLASYLAALMAALGCSGAGNNEGPGVSQGAAVPPPAGTRLVFSDSSLVALEWASGLADPLTEVLGDNESFVERWNEAMVGREPGAEAPSIDFDREIVLLAAQGEQPSTGYRIQVDSALWQDDRVDVYVTAVSPDPATCMTGMALSRPIHMVRMPRTDLPITFHVETIIQTC